MYLNRAEFYITHVCNYNCEHCNRFNNYHFTGQQLWKDYSNVYTQWSKRLDIGAISILGGEPLVNPSINDWISGLTLLWPTTQIEVVTNGTRLNNVKNLYNTIKKQNGQVFLHIGLHNREQLQETIKNVLEFLDEPIVNTKIYPDNINELWQMEYNKIKNSDWPDCKTPNDFINLPSDIKKVCFENNFSDEIFLNFNGFVGIIDKNKVRVEIHIEDIFHKSALTRDKNKFLVHNSNPQKAHSICFEKHNHHFIKGKLYKCNVSGVLPEFYKQFHVMLSDDDKELMNSYVPLTIYDSDCVCEKFINELPNEIPQCKFCPEWLDAYNLNPSTTKIKIEKKHR